VLNSKHGPLMPAFSVQKIGNALGWGIVNDAPNSLVREIGHTSPYTSPASQFCLPGSATKPACFSYDVPTPPTAPARCLSHSRRASTNGRTSGRRGSATSIDVVTHDA
jgi:hypothetical protein